MADFYIVAYGDNQLNPKHQAGFSTGGTTLTGLSNCLGTPYGNLCNPIQTVEKQPIPPGGTSQVYMMYDGCTLSIGTGTPNIISPGSGTQLLAISDSSFADVSPTHWAIFDDSNNGGGFYYNYKVYYLCTGGC